MFAQSYSAGSDVAVAHGRIQRAGKTLLARAIAGEAGVPFFFRCAAMKLVLYPSAELCLLPTGSHQQTLRTVPI